MKRIPGFRLGILFLLPYRGLAGEPTPLLHELLAETNGPALRAESLRVLALDPANEMARLGKALTQPGSGGNAPLTDLAASAHDPDVKATAAYTLGVRAQTSGDAATAWRHLRTAFLAGGRESITLRSAWRLSRLRAPVPADDEALLSQVHTIAGSAGQDIRQECRHEDQALRPGQGLFSLPARTIVGFYKTAVAPAIGSRCSLTPSCSAYFLDASRKHGLLGFPMLADRLIREPSVVADAAHPLSIGARTRYADPVEAHDFWW